MQKSRYPASLRAVNSGGAKGGGAAGACVPPVKPCAPAVPRQLSYGDVDHLNESVGSEQQITLKTSTMMLSISRLIVFFVNMADIRLMFYTRSLAVAERPHDA